MGNRTRMSLVALAATGAIAAGANAGFVNGDIIYTDENSNGIFHYSGGSSSLLHTVTGTDVRVAGITRVNGHYYVNSGLAAPGTPSTAAVYRVKKLFNAPNQSTLASSNPILNPIGIAYHRASDQLLLINNPGPGSQPDEGVLGVKTSNGDVAIVFEEDNTLPRPRYTSGTRIIRDVNNADRFYINSTNGGALDGGGIDDNGSQIYQLDMAADGTGVMSLVVDLSFTAFGNITFTRSITTDGTKFYFGDNNTSAIYSIDIDGNLASLAQLATGLTRPNAVEWNPYTNKIVWSDNVDEAIYQMNIDGTGIETLETGVSARGFYFVPTPGAATLLGLGALVGVRRRR